VAALRACPGARINRYRCSLPGLTGFTVYRRQGTNKATMTEPRNLSEKRSSG